MRRITTVEAAATGTVKRTIQVRAVWLVQTPLLRGDGRRLSQKLSAKVGDNPEPGVGL
jgi:hypothetical protein